MKKISFPILLVLLINCAIYAKPQPARYHLLMDRNWKFQLGDNKNASSIAFDDAAWRMLNLPHDWSIEGQFSKDEPTGGGLA